MLTGKSRLICTLGDPVSHSLSPLMHNRGFELLNLDYAYLCFNTKINEMEDTIAALKRLDARGFSCTMPVKVRAYELADKLSPAAELMQAVNTAVIEDGKIHGHNTDGIGFTTAIKEKGCNIHGNKITVLGCGGAATAMIVQAALEGAAEISVFNRSVRSFHRAKQLSERLRSVTSTKINVCNFFDTEYLKTEVSESSILANATPVGMASQLSISPISDLSIFHKGLFVMDAVYNPLETQLVKDAKTAGCVAFGGLSMLLYQGAAAFKCWTGRDMPIDEIREILFRQVHN